MSAMRMNLRRLGIRKSPALGIVCAVCAAWVPGAGRNSGPARHASQHRRGRPKLHRGQMYRSGRLAGSRRQCVAMTRIRSSSDTRCRLATWVFQSSELSRCTRWPLTSSERYSTRWRMTPDPACELRPARGRCSTTCCREGTRSEARTASAHAAVTWGPSPRPRYASAVSSPASAATSERREQQHTLTACPSSTTPTMGVRCGISSSVHPEKWRSSNAMSSIETVPSGRAIESGKANAGPEFDRGLQSVPRISPHVRAHCESPKSVAHLLPGLQVRLPSLGERQISRPTRRLPLLE